MYHSHLNDMEIPGTNRFIPKECELGTTSSKHVGVQNNAVKCLLGI